MAKNIRPRKETQRHRDAFEAWYAADRHFRTISEKLGIHLHTLYDWADRYDWHQRANQRDAAVAEQIESTALQERIKRLEQHRRIGTLLRVRGTEWLVNNEIKSARDALACIKSGIEIERASHGLPDRYIRIINAETIEELEAMEQELEAAFGLAEGDTG